LILKERKENLLKKWRRHIGIRKSTPTPRDPKDHLVVYFIAASISSWYRKP
jgi:hypothetical protein